MAEDPELVSILDRIAEKIAKRSITAEDVDVEYVDRLNEYRRKICSSRIVVAAFTSPTCPACAVYRPIFYDTGRKLMSRYWGKLRFIEVDVFRLADVAAELGVTATPTTIVFVGCRPWKKIIGVVDSETLRELVEPLLEEGVGAAAL